MWFFFRVCISAFATVSFLNVAAFAQNNGANNSPVVDPPGVTPQPGYVPDNVIFLGDDHNRVRKVFIADKAQRTLTAWAHKATGPELVGAYPMDIGKREGDKTAEGDHKTPEGLYFIQERLEGPTLNYEEYGIRAFTLDYPNFFDKRLGKTGSGIWLHAVPDTTSLFRGSRGCVVVRNQILEKLTPMISLKATPMIIVDKVNYIPVAELKKRQESARKWVHGWREAWETKNLDAYLSFYDDEFKAMNMSKRKWREYKAALNKKYSYIKVRATDTMLISRRDEGILHFVQDYESDRFKAFGEKSLYLRKNGDEEFKILTE